MDSKLTARMNGTRSAFPYAERSTKGLTKREYFAAAALTGLLAGSDKTYISKHATIDQAWEFADAMLAGSEPRDGE